MAKPKIPSRGSVVYVNSDDSFIDVQRPRLAAAEAHLPIARLDAPHAARQPLPAVQLRRADRLESPLKPHPHVHYHNAKRRYCN